MPRATEARVIRIRNRFFYGFDRIGRVKTSWSLAGAKLYLPSSDAEFDHDIGRLRHRRLLNVVALLVRCEEDSDAL